MPSPSIERHPRRQEIIDAILSGKPSRAVAKMAGISHVAVQNYKNRVLGPSLTAAAKIQAAQPLAESSTTAIIDRATEAVELTKAAARVQPFFERNEKLWNIALTAVQDARKAVHTVTTQDGNEVPVGRDFSALASMLGQAHKNQELFGKAARIFDDGPQNNTQNNTIIVVMPAPATVPGVQEPDSLTIDVTGEK